MEVETDEATVDVYFQIGYTKILDVDTQNQRFQAEVIIESKWKDPGVKNLSDNLSQIAWKPDLYIDNAINDVKEEIFYKIVLGNQRQVMVSEIRKIKGLFHENLELVIYYIQQFCICIL